MKFCETHLRAYPAEDMGCWVCYSERNNRKKQAQKAVGLVQVSEKKKKREASLAKVRQEKKKQVPFCESCGRTGVTLTYSHILSVKQYPEYEDHPDNALLECLPCHEQWEHSPLEEKMKQASWPRKLNVILKLEPRHWNKMQLK